MKAHYYLIAAVLSALVAAPAVVVSEQAKLNFHEIIGQWKAVGSVAVLGFQDPGMFTIDADADGKVELEGTVLVEGANGVFRAMSVSGARFAGCEGGYGVYAIRQSRADSSVDRGKSLELTAVKENCQERLKILAGSWVPR